VRAACLVRWSREAGSDAEALQLELRLRYLAALESYPTQICAKGPGQATGSSGIGGGEGEDGAWASLRPCGRVSDAINSSTVPVQVASVYPHHITEAALRRAGIRSCGGGGGGGGGGGVGVLQVASLEAAAESAAAAAAAAGRELHLVVDRLGRAERLRELLLLQPATAKASALAGGAAGGSSGSGSIGAGGGARAWPAPAVAVHVADWCCSTASQRAAAGAGLLGEHRLAELLGCGDSPLVMDGVAWR
jgi:hypothetical protein